tara:strand:+ start:179 stop:529 length:351 start_codon:yes stop_codon:yes gene_type:complete
MSREIWEGPERRAEPSTTEFVGRATRVEQEETASFLAFFAALIVIVCLMFNWDVVIYSTDTTVAEYTCATNEGLKWFSKDSGGDMQVFCNNKAKFSLSSIEVATMMQEVKNVQTDN